jgi:hypothetical protein
VKVPRRLTLTIVAFILVISSLLFLLFLTRDGDAMSRRNFGKIENGMTRDQIESILGPPTEGYFGLGSGLKFKGVPTKEAGVWKGKKFELSVWFDAGGLVLHKAGRSSESGILDRLHDWLGW